MILRSALLSVLVFAATVAFAGNDFGTREETEALADQMVALINQHGMEAAIRAMHDPDMPFVKSRMGVNIFQGTTIVADNREPETVAADYSVTADLTGVIVWPRILDAAQTGGDAVLMWYHYDTQEAYEYHCHVKRADRDEALVMVCR